MCNNKENKLSAEERYEITINARNTNYDNFNKWATYFSVIIGAIFVSYYELSKENNNDKFTIEISLLCILGWSSSFLWYLSCRGFYFWNKTYIKLLEKQQDEMQFNREEKIYGDLSGISSSYWPHKELNVSTPTIAILLSLIITIAWGILLIKYLKRLWYLAEKSWISDFTKLWYLGGLFLPLILVWFYCYYIKNKEKIVEN